MAGTDRLRGRLGYDLIVGLGLRGGGALASFALTFAIARHFGAGVVGLYQIGLATASLVSLGASLGLPLILVREAAGLQAQGRLGDLAATFLASRRTIHLAGICCMVAVALLAWPLGTSVIGNSEAVVFILVSAPLVIFLPALRLNNELLRSLGKVWLSQAFEGIFYTSLTALVIAALWIGGVDYPPVLIPAIYLANVAIAWLVSRAVVARKIAGWGDGSRQLRATAGLIAISAQLVMMLSEWLILMAIGGLLGLADAGIYRTVVLICSLFQLVSASFATMAGPHLARQRAAHDRAQFFRTIRISGLLGLALCVVPGAVVLCAPEWLLGLFGPQFREGAGALVIMAIAQLIGVANGPVAPATLMLGREAVNVRIELAASVISFGGAIVLIAPFGLVGAACALLAASIFRCVCSRLMLNRFWRVE